MTTGAYGRLWDIVAALLIAMVAAGSLFAGASLRSNSVAITLIAAYVFLVGQIAIVTAVLSPLHLVTRAGLAVAEAVVLAISGAAWLLRDRPRPDWKHALWTVREALSDRIVLVFLLAVSLGLAYELVTVFTVPANNWDSLTYHLARVAAWTQHRGIFWVPNAPTDRINEFQPVAEQQILFLFVATGKGALFALPQFGAQIAVLLSIYRIARRLGSSPPAAACAAALFATLSVVAEEATTAQNDLVAASCVVAGIALLLEHTTVTALLAGVAIALGLGVKLTTALVLPVVLLIALHQGRKRVLLMAAATSSGFAVLALWSFVMNIVHTGHVLGHGGGRTEATTSPSPHGSVVTLFKVTYRLLDVSGYTARTMEAVTALGVVAACALVVASRTPRGARLGKAGVSSVVVLLLPAVVLLGGRAVHTVADGLSANIVASPNKRVNEDYSAFGPVGAGALIAAIAVAFRHRDHGRARRALAVSLPVFLLVVALSSKYNPWLSRFLIVPVAVTAPLFADLFRRRTTALALAAVSVLSLALVLQRNELKPLHSAHGRPWSLTRYEAVRLNWQPAAGVAADGLDSIVPAEARLGAVLGSDAPAYLLYGASLERKVVYLPETHPGSTACRLNLRYVVVDDASRSSLHVFSRPPWRVQPLTDSSPPYWTLLTRTGGCTSQ